jgi:hypothetical protein
VLDERITANNATARIPTLKFDANVKSEDFSISVKC